MKNNRVLSLIGLATKAGKTVSGEFSTEKSVKTGKGLLVIVAEDASENTKKKFRNMCSFYEEVELAHPLAVALGQIVVDGNDVHPFAGQGVQVGGQDER